MPAISDHPERPPASLAPAVPPPPSSKRRRRGLTIVWLALLAIFGFVGYRYYQNAEQQKQAAAARQAARQGNRPVSVVTAPVRAGELPVYLRGLGTVAPFNTVVVKSRIDGQLIAIHFTEGQMVRKDELLAEVDPRPFQVQLEQAEGQLAKDQAQLKDAQVNLARYELLWKEQVIAKQQLDTQAAAVGQVEGAIQADQASINNARLQLTYCKITAPIAGRAGLRLIDVGNMIHASDPNGLVIIDQMQPISVLFTIPADSLQPVLQKLRAGARLRVDAYDREDRNRISSGTLLTVDNQIDVSTGTTRLKATFANPGLELFPNQFVNCRLLLEMKQNAVIVPAPAIQRGPQGNYVYVVTSQGTAAVRPVAVGITEGDDVEIESGLQAGETVVVEGQDKLQDGSKVETRAVGPANGGRGFRPRHPVQPSPGGLEAPPAGAPQAPPRGQPPPAGGRQAPAGGRRPSR